MLRRFLFALAATFLLGVPAQAAAPPVTVFAAASLKDSLDAVARAYEAATGRKANVAYGASSTLAKQIENGAPAAVFISADADWMNALQARKLVADGSRVDLLSNHLALIGPADSKTRLRIAPGFPLAAALGRDGRLALAGPEVPAGRYGEASLKALGVWSQVENRLARGENVRAALAFVARGECPLGIVYDTDAKVEPKVRIVGLFPDSSHPPIIYPAALVAGASGGQPFLSFLRSPRAAAIFRHYGFVVLRRP